MLNWKFCRWKIKTLITLKWKFINNMKIFFLWDIASISADNKFQSWFLFQNAELSWQLNLVEVKWNFCYGKQLMQSL